MVSKQQQPDLERRIQKLEAILALLIGFDGDVPNDELDYLFHRFLRRRDFEPEFEFLIRDIIDSRNKYTTSGTTNDGLYKSIEQHDRQIRILSDRVGELSKKLSTLEGKIGNISGSFNELKSDSLDYFTNISLGLNLADVKVKRFLPVSVYISIDDPQIVMNVEASLNELFKSMGLSIDRSFPSETGSWYKRFVVKTKEFLTSEEATEVITKSKRAVELAGLDKPRADVNKTNAEAWAMVVGELKDVPKAAIQIGSMLIVKLTNELGEPELHTRILSEEQLIQLENNRNLLKNPDQILNLLGS